MKILIIIVIVVVLVTGGVLVYKNFFVQRKMHDHLRRKLKVLEPLLEKLNAQQTIGAAEILTLAINPSLRHAVFRMLEDFGRAELFPTEYLTREKGAESHLVNWLEYPTELDRSPEEIELISTVLHKSDDGLQYFVFKFMSLQPDWAARNGWMIGVAGPYESLALPYDSPLRVFSRFKILGTTTAEQEVEWVHDNINPDQTI